LIHELRTYTVIPGKLNEYLRLAAEVGEPARGERYGRLEGHWYSEFGALNQVVQLRSYADLAERERLRPELARSEAWQQYLQRSQPLLSSQANKILRPSAPLGEPGGKGNLYELRWYRTQPGQAQTWLRHFEAILPLREKYMKRVGLWQSEIGPLNEVLHIWAFPDLAQRSAARAQLGREPEWQRFLEVSTPLLAEMHNALLLPSPHSPRQ
jgi:hypothetical protein